MLREVTLGETASLARGAEGPLQELVRGRF